jgi:prevent-host-death family protein
MGTAFGANVLQYVLHYGGRMRTITVREANQHFSRYIAAVDLGEELIITKRGREVARLVPARPPVASAAEMASAMEQSRSQLAALLAQLPKVCVGGPYARDDFYD